MARTSDAALALIVAAEIGSEAEYTARGQRPSWPGGGSGVTIGIGCDLGELTPADVRQHWVDLLPQATVSRLAQVAGVRGQAAQVAAAALQDIAVPLAVAQAEFRSRELPPVEMEVRGTFPGADALPDDCFGALVSVVYNRGASLTSPDGRRVEMQQIHDALVEARARDVPAYLRAMKRLWPASAAMDGLRTRRTAEAALFEAAIAPTA